MSVLFRCRIDPEVLSKADKITGKLGTSTPEMVRIFVTQIARTGKVPVSLESGAEDKLAGPWKQRASTLESFYDATKAW